MLQITIQIKVFMGFRPGPPLYYDFILLCNFAPLFCFDT